MEPINWRGLIPPDIHCDGKCGRAISKGYSIPGRNLDFCEQCYLEQSENVRSRCVAFENTPCQIDSRFIAHAYAAGMCLQSYPCQHAGILELKGFLDEKDEVAWYDKQKVKDESQPLKRLHMIERTDYQFQCRLNGLEICKLGLLTGDLSKIDHHVLDYLGRVGPINPGDIIPIRNGITVKVHESFVDPRNTKPGKWMVLFMKWSKSFPHSFENFKAEIDKVVEEKVE